MVTVKNAFSGFSVKDLMQTKKFYIEVLGLTVHEEGGMGLNINLPNGASVFAYPKSGHESATFTILNFEVLSIDEAVDSLVAKGIVFERYEGLPTDEKGIMRGLSQNKGPDIAWFKDPSGNILSFIQNTK